jgi:hypothetical protein
MIFHGIVESLSRNGWTKGYVTLSLRAESGARASIDVPADEARGLNIGDGFGVAPVITPELVRLAA